MTQTGLAHEEVVKSREQGQELLKKMPKSVDWSKISAYEDRDNTASSQTFACSGEVCEVVDLTK